MQCQRLNSNCILHVCVCVFLQDEVTVELESWEEKARKEYEQYLITENKLLIELGVVEPLPKQEG